MANTKISNLTAVTSTIATDILPLVVDPGGTPLTRKITLANFITSFFAAISAKVSIGQNVEVGAKVAMNTSGGVMVKLTNKTGAATVKGHVVQSNSGQNNSVVKITVNVPAPIGAFYEDGIADGQEAWVVVAGIADVYFIGNTTRGHIARGFITGDAGYVTGQALDEAVPTAPFATDKHFYEIGHVLESRTGAGLAKCVLHFN